jgi:outer membrane receptor protein involved in Fe transport
MVSEGFGLRAGMIAGLAAATTAMAVGGCEAAAASASAAPASGTAVEEVVVTAQRKSEASQTVPIAVSAFSEKTLEKLKIEGGPDLLKAIPNVSFTKTNFSGYNLTIRGIGTQAISVATDPGVSVNFNGTSLIRNRLFEQEFFDVDQVLVLRGPQGTLYGRNATAGAVNIISAKPVDYFTGQIKGEIGTYGDKRLSGFINFPLVGDKLDLRIAGSWTKRDGYSYDSLTNTSIDGRDLYSLRTTLGFKPTERLHGQLVWEHFNEDDNRARSSKQLCTRDPGLTSIDGVAITNPIAQAFTSQGCQDASLYSPNAYGTPNGLSIPFILAGADGARLGYTHGGTPVYLINPIDPYGGLMQSPNLREISSAFQPVYRARSDILELNFDYDITDQLKFVSQTAYDHDNYFSQEDYDRFTTLPGIFNNSIGLRGFGGPTPNITPNGVYCDPQLGCSASIEGVDQSSAVSKQFSQEVRLQSSFKGPFNFSIGANYTYYHTVEDYYVFFNVLSALAQTNLANNATHVPNCFDEQTATVVPVTLSGPANCIYIDPNPLNSINGLGHNYFLSENPYTVNSAAAFGEVYYKIRPNIKLTGGFRYTDDNKSFTPVPSQALLNADLGGTVSGGYPSLPNINQHWGVATGRLGIDWTPQLSFTNQTLIYAFYNRGYKGGGANPPPIGLAPNNGVVQLLPYPQTFQPEYVNAFEVGTKNALLGGRLILNADTFFYNYKGYQVSQIEDDTAVNQNFNAEVWGAELESVFQATREIRFTYNMGYQDSSLARGSESIDVMNRTQGNPNYIVFKGNELIPDNCVVAASYVAGVIANDNATGQPQYAGLPYVCPGSEFSTTPSQYLPNGGQGFFADLSGHNLPNQPHWTESLGVDYSVELPWGWVGTLHGDVYHQSSSWARIYEDPIDRLNAWTNINLRLTVARAAAGLTVEVYVKNLLNGTPITGSFINSDNTALTTNVFTLDPRVVGASLTKRF